MDAGPARAEIAGACQFDMVARRHASRIAPARTDRTTGGRWHRAIMRSIDGWKRDPEGVLGRQPPRTSTGSSRWTKVFDAEAGVYGRWFAGAECNTCFNAVDRHVEQRPRRSGRADPRQRHHRHASATSPMRELQATRSWRSPPCSRDHGIGKGDRVIIYMPMVAGGGVRHAGLRPARRRAFRRVRRLRRAANSPPASTTRSRS